MARSMNPRHSTDFTPARGEMLRLIGRYVSDRRVIDAMAAVPREAFVPAQLRHEAYADRPLPIGDGQTISQPLIVAIMLDALHLRPADRVLDVGTGSGYQAAILAQLAAEVVTVERMPELLARGRETLAQYPNVHPYPAGDVLGRSENAPYDAIVAAASAPHVPRALIEQLAERGRMVLPVGTRLSQELVRVTKTPHGIDLERLGPCAFVPLIDEEAWPSAPHT